MTVAQHESVQGARIDAEEIGVVDQRLRREAEIHQNVPRLRAAPGLDVHREAELADQRPAGRLVAADPPAEMLDVDAGNLPAWRDGELIAVRYDSNRQTIDLGHRAGDCLGPQ